MIMELEEARNKIIANLRNVYDPEIPVNIYDLGLVYEINLDEWPVVTVTHTLTSAFCPAQPMILLQAFSLQWLTLKTLPTAISTRYLTLRFRLTKCLMMLSYS